MKPDHRGRRHQAHAAPQLNRLLAVMRDETLPSAERLAAAIEAAPYIHERPAPSAGHTYRRRHR